MDATGPASQRTPAGIVGLLLAAGQSRRFGANKLLHPLTDGTPLVVASVRHLTAVLPRTLAVVADADDAVAQLLRAEGVELVVNDNAGAGMGTSIAAGVRASPEARGWLIALGDMPAVPARVTAALQRCLVGGKDLVAPVCHGRRGHPVGFSARYRDVLGRLCGDRGARDILDRERGALTLLTVDHPGVLLDIDTPDCL